MNSFNRKPTHAPVKAYYEPLQKFGAAEFDNEGNIRRAFEELLGKCARPFEWFSNPKRLIPQEPVHNQRQVQSGVAVLG